MLIIKRDQWVFSCGIENHLSRMLGSPSLDLPVPSSEMGRMPALPISQNYLGDQMGK